MSVKSLIFLCHFCELHGPRWLFCSQLCKARSSLKDLVSAEKPTDQSRSESESNGSRSPRSMMTNDTYDDGGGSHDIGGSCPACAHHSKDILSYSETDSVVSPMMLPAQVNKLVRTSCLRSLSSEVVGPGKEGPMMFGDDENGYTYAYVFKLQDSEARGFQRWMSLCFMEKDRLKIVASWQFLSFYCSRVVKYLKLQSDKLYREESKTLSHPSIIAGIRSRQRNQALRSLAKLCGVENIFDLLHSTFAWILGCYDSRLVISSDNTQLNLNLSLRSLASSSFILGPAVLGSPNTSTAISPLSHLHISRNNLLPMSMSPLALNSPARLRSLSSSHHHLSGSPKFGAAAVHPYMSSSSQHGETPSPILKGRDRRGSLLLSSVPITMVPAVPAVRPGSQERGIPIPSSTLPSQQTSRSGTPSHLGGTPITGSPIGPIISPEGLPYSPIPTPPTADLPISQFSNIVQLASALGFPVFRVLVYNIIIGNQLVVRGSDQEIVGSLLGTAQQLLPNECVDLVVCATEYRESYEKFLGLPLGAEIPDHVDPASLVVLDIIPKVEASPSYGTSQQSAFVGFNVHCSGPFVPTTLGNSIVQLFFAMHNHTPEMKEEFLNGIKVEWLLKTKVMMEYQRSLQQQQPTLTAPQLEEKMINVMKVMHLIPSDLVVFRVWFAAFRKRRSESIRVDL